MDPIIEIMKLFIKAYKTYTVKTITKRTENVDTNTLSEYTSFGVQSADDTGRQGPYRNNKLFDLWENAVNDIRKDRKYQAIFTENAKLRLPKVTDPNPSNSEDWVIKPNAGAAFRKFINEVLDGDTLYKSGSTGAVSTFIEKYFGDGSVSEKDGKSLQGTDLTDAAEIATEIDKNSIKLQLEKEVTIGDTPNTFFTIDGKGPSATDAETFNANLQRSFFIDKVQAGYVWLICTIHLKKFNTYLDLLEPKREISQNEFPRTLSNDKTAPFTYTKISLDNFKKLKAGQKVSLVTVDSKQVQKIDKLQITDIYSLNKVDGGEVYKLSDEERTKFNEVLGKAGIKNDVKSEVDKKTGTETKPI
jgi:hypothetical protein